MSIIEKHEHILLLIKTGNTELEEVDHIKYLDNVHKGNQYENCH